MGPPSWLLYWRSWFQNAKKIRLRNTTNLIRNHCRSQGKLLLYCATVNFSEWLNHNSMFALELNSIQVNNSRKFTRIFIMLEHSENESFFNSMTVILIFDLAEGGIYPRTHITVPRQIACASLAPIPSWRDQSSILVFRNQATNLVLFGALLEGGSTFYPK